VRKQQVTDDDSIDFSLSDDIVKRFRVSHCRRGGGAPGVGSLDRRDGGFVGKSSFGISGPESELFAHFGITAERVAAEVRARL